MMAALIRLAVGAGIPDRFAKAAVFTVLGILIALVLWGARCAYDRSVIEHHETKQENKTLKRIAPANDQAAAERATETIYLQRQEQEAHDAIHSAPDGKPSAAAQRHNCQRLRRAGTDTSRFPECRAAGSD